MIRICFPLVRYTLKMPVPPADIPRLKNLACTVNRGESGSTRTANGSSKDSSISCSVKELSRLKGGLFQSNSILSVGMYFQRPCNVFTLYLHGGAGIVNRLFQKKFYSAAFQGNDEIPFWGSARYYPGIVPCKPGLDDAIPSGFKVV